jgi:hypothetical protein
MGAQAPIVVAAVYDPSGGSGDARPRLNSGSPVAVATVWEARDNPVEGLAGG